MKKLTILTIVFLLLFPYGNLFAKKKGAKLEIWGKGGRFIRGELIAVKQNSLVMMESGTDVSIDIDNIKAIEIEKKSKAGLGLILGGFTGALIGRATYTKPKNTGLFTPDFGPGVNTLAGGILGGLIGLAIGAAAGSDETIQIEGKSDSEIKEVLKKLRSKARIPEYR